MAVRLRGRRGGAANVKHDQQGTYITTKSYKCAVQKAQ